MIDVLADGYNVKYGARSIQHEVCMHTTSCSMEMYVYRLCFVLLLSLCVSIGVVDAGGEACCEPTCLSV